MLQRCLGDSEHIYLHEREECGKHYPDFPNDCSDLADYQKKSYEHNIAIFAETAVKKVFENQQMTRTPSYACFVQVEHGKNLHVHLVLSGDGLTKYTAKNFRSKLAVYFYAQLEQKQKEELRAIWKPKLGIIYKTNFRSSN